MESLGHFTLFVILCVVGAFSDGYALSKGWEWFISSTFGLTPLTIIQAVGFGMFIRFITTKVKASDLKASESEDAMKNLVKLFFVSQVINLISLITGYIVKGLM